MCTRGGWIALAWALGCSSTSGSADGTASLSGETGTSLPTGTATAPTSTGESDDGEIKLDLPVPDAGGGGDGIPKTCEAAANADTTVGCQFFATDLDLVGVYDQNQYAVAVANVQLDQVATVVVEYDNGGGWQPAVPEEAVDPLDLFVFELPDRHIDNTGHRPGFAYRVTSDVPIIAYQFEPLEAGDSFTSDASLLYPVSAWDTLHYVLAQQKINTAQSSYFTIVSAVDGTETTITPTVDTSPGLGVPAGIAGSPFTVMMDEGDMLQVAIAYENEDPTGTKVESNPDHPIAVWTGNTCALVPLNSGACDHLQDQMFGVRLWGTSFVASRMPVRSTQEPIEDSMWQLFANEDDTQITFTGSANVTGLPGPTTLQAGDVLELYVGGPMADPGDFIIESSKPIATANYMTGSSTVNPLQEPTLGDPSIVQLAPVEQFLPRYVVYVPNHWMWDVATITRVAGTEVTLDDVAIPDADFIAVGPAYEAARVPISDGVHVLHGEQPFSIVVVGYDDDDSYAYLGGAGTAKINPVPEG